MSLADLENISKKYKVLEDKFLKYYKKTLLDNKSFPLDYIMNLPKDLRNL